jgi:nucleoside-diphosphate kinase
VNPGRATIPARRDSEETAVEQTFVMVKPDGVERGLVGDVISRLERKGLVLRRMRMLTIDEDLARRHYAEHVEKPFFPELLAFITRGPVIAMVWEGKGAVGVARTLMGPTDPTEAAPGTIRGDYGLIVTENLVHGSDSPDSAAREIGLFFE